MAKKQKTEKVVEPLIEKDFEEVETPVMETPKPKKQKDTWEIKDRRYILKNGAALSHTMKSAGIYYFDEEKGYETEVWSKIDGVWKIISLHYSVIAPE